MILHFLIYINDLPNDVICDPVIYADDTTLNSNCDQASDLWQQSELLLNSNLIYETLRIGVRSDLLRKLNWFHLTGLITMVLLM